MYICVPLCFFTACSSRLTPATFEGGLEGYSQDRNDGFDWTRHNGSTPTRLSGPVADVTLGTNAGEYSHCQLVNGKAMSGCSSGTSVLRVELPDVDGQCSCMYSVFVFVSCLVKDCSIVCPLQGSYCARCSVLCCLKVVLSCWSMASYYLLIVS